MASCHILRPAPLHTQNNSLRYLVIQPTIPTDISNPWEVFKQLRTCIWPLPAHALSHILFALSTYDTKSSSWTNNAHQILSQSTNHPTWLRTDESSHFLISHGTMSHWTWLVLLLPPVHPSTNQIRHLDLSSKDQVVHPYPWSDHTRPALPTPRLITSNSLWSIS